LVCDAKGRSGRKVEDAVIVKSLARSILSHPALKRQQGLKRSGFGVLR
jgi:hypothetical protein